MTIKSQLITVALNGSGVPAATCADATISDVFTSVISTTEAVTGTYGLLQKAGLFVAGMAVQNYRLNGRLNPFGAQ